MLNSILRCKSNAFRLTACGTVAAICIALAVGLPQIFHIAGGASAGAVWMPMYAPALIAGCLLGAKWGVLVGVLSPLVSFGFTTVALDAAMPALSRLPYMMLEIGVFGLVSGLFASKIAENAVYSFPATLTAMFAGRAVYVLYSLAAGAGFGHAMSSVQAGLPGLFVQAAAVPVAVILLSLLLKKWAEKDKMSSSQEFELK